MRISLRTIAKHFSWLLVAIFLFARPLGAQHSALAADAQKPPLLSAAEVGALDAELSGELAKLNLEEITRQHRVRGSRGFEKAAEFVADRARAYGLSDVTKLEYPADGKTFFGTQKSRMAWDADFAELWELHRENGKVVPANRLANWDTEPVSLAEDSESADVTTELVDVGEGISESDYSGKDVKGKIVLASSQPGAVEPLAVEIHGAAGIVSYAQNQKQAWWGEDETLIRWGHLDSFGPVKTFAFMVSLRTARSLRERLSHNEQIQLHAVVRAGQHPGQLTIVTAAIPGADPKLREEEIVFSCHLDHQRPGANDNASGCVAILEVARTLQKLIAEGRIARPARTLRFIWPPEIEGTETLLSSEKMKSVSMSMSFSSNTNGETVEYHDPMPSDDHLHMVNILMGTRTPLYQHFKAVIHMDMVGGGPVTKAIFHVTRGPMSLPSFVYDVGEAFGDFVNRESDLYASTGAALYPFVSAEGGKEALQAEFADYSMGSDHDVYQEGSFRIPAIYLNDWPDRYIHTNGDTSANIDPTKLKRAAFIGAASGYFLAGMSATNVPEILSTIERESLRRIENRARRSSQLNSADHVLRPGLNVAYERAVMSSIERFAPLDDSAKKEVDAYVKMWNEYTHGPWLDNDVVGLISDEANGRIIEKQNLRADVFTRNPEVKGPMAVFGYDYLTDHLAAKNLPRPKLSDYQGLWGAGEEYTYEVLNFVDGKRNVSQIREAVSIEYGDVPLEMVEEYLKSLEAIGVLKRVSTPSPK